MAVEVESQGQLQEFLDIIKRRRWQVVLPALFIFSLGCTLAVLIPKKYEVSTRIELKPVRIEEDYQFRNTRDTSTSAEIVNAAYHIKHYKRIRKVLEDMDIEEFAKLDEPAKHTYVERMRDDLVVNVLEKPKNQGSDFVDIEFKDVDAERAAEFLNRLAREWVVEVIDRDRAVLQSEKEVHQNAKEDAWNKYHDTWTELTELVKANELQKSELEGGQFFRGDDPFLERLEEDEARREAVTLELATLRAELEVTDKRYKDEPPKIPFSFKQTGVNLDEIKAAAELKIKTLRTEQEKLKPAHSRWQVIEDLIEQEYLKIESAESYAREDTVGTQFVENPAKLTLKTEVVVLEKKIEAKAANLDALSKQISERRSIYQERVENTSRAKVLKQESDSWLDAYNTANASFLEKERALKILNQAYGNPYDIAEEARAPDKPSEPNPLMIVTFALVAGLALGLGGALLSEFSKNGYRGVADVTRVMTVPVLGVVNTILTRAEARRKRFRRLLVGLSSLVLIGGLAWFTYAWAERREWLSTELVNQIEEIRMKLR